MRPQVVILAAGLGTRLGNPFPKPLTPLSSGETILGRQVESIRDVLGKRARIHIVVGFKLDLVVEASPDVTFVYNEAYDRTNTNRSLLKALRLSSKGGVLWLNGDVVFEPSLLEQIEPLIVADNSFVCVNTSSVADEEVKYTLDADGYIDQLSKQVTNGRGEAVGINYVSKSDKSTLIKRLAQCDEQDYFERGIEMAIEKDGQRWSAIDISEHLCLEVDFREDLQRANQLLDTDEAAR